MLRTKIRRVLGLIPLALMALPQQFALAADAAGGGGQSSLARALMVIGVGVTVSFAAGLGAIGQGRAAGSALESIGRNPDCADRLFVPLIIGLAFIESLVLYALVMAFILEAKI